MPIRLKPIDQQIIVITGASSGIGLATAKLAARQGAKVVLAARNEEALKEAVAEIERRGGKAAYCAADVADEDAAERIGAVADAAFGGFDTWVNDAATALYARLADVTLAEHRQVFDIGYFGTVQGALYAAKRLGTQGGAIINIGSVLSDRSVPVQGAYCAMKHAVKGFTETLRMELENEGKPISVTLIKPNGIDTPYPEHARNKMGVPARIPPLVYDPDLVARAIVFAAQHKRRELLVGGGGLLLTQLSNIFARPADIGMELVMDEKGQSIDQPPEPGTEDNLFAPKKDGRERSNQDIFVRKTSLVLEAQMHPLTTLALGVGSATLGAASAGMFGRRASRPAAAALGLGATALMAAIAAGERIMGARIDKEKSMRTDQNGQLDREPFQAELQAGIADENAVPQEGEVTPPAAEQRLDPAPYQPELAAGIADENAIPTATMTAGSGGDAETRSAAHPS